MKSTRRLFLKLNGFASIVAGVLAKQLPGNVETILNYGKSKTEKGWESVRMRAAGLNIIQYYHKQFSLLDKMSSSKNITRFSPVKSPKRPDPALFEAFEKASQMKLNEKIHKLKHALKSAEKHNEELHAKVRFYKQQCGEFSHHQEELKKLRRKYEALHSQFDLKLLENQEMKIKLEIMEREQKFKNGKGKQWSENKIKELSEEVKCKEIKIEEGEEKIQKLQQVLRKQAKRIKQLEQASEKYIQKENKQKSHQINKIHQELQLKISESHEHARQIGRLKDSLRDSSIKLENANSLIYEQTQKNKVLAEEQKQSKKLIGVFQKQNSAMRERCEKIKLQIFEKNQKINVLQRERISFEYEREKHRERYEDLEKREKKICKDLEVFKSEHSQLQIAYQETLNFHYQTQREFQRELHTIVKEITRRHIVSKSMIMSMGSSNIYSSGSPPKNQGPVQRPLVQ